MTQTSLYEVLGVSRDVTPDDLKAAYRKLARELHPDVNPDDAAAEARFKQINAAHEVLSDPERRKLYDEFGELSTRSGFDPEKARAARRWQRQGHAPGFGFEFGEGDVDLGDLFGDLLRGRSQPRRPRRGADVQAELEIDLASAASGTTQSFRLSRPDRCGACNGTGRAAPNGCGLCAGRGAVERTVTIDVKIPAGTEDGQRLRLAGQGAAGLRGGPSGDLLITIRLARHPVFERSGLDLALVLPITIQEAMFGGVVDVPTLDGEVELKVPGGSNTGRRLRLRGKGLPGGGGRRGDLYVTLHVHVPTPPEDAQAAQRAAAAAEALGALYGSELQRSAQAPR